MTLKLTHSLAELNRADLVRRLQELEEAYQFKHNLIQESAYTSLLKNDRRNLHRTCAHALEQSYPDDLDEIAALLARHYAEAGDEPKTFAYARRAGDVAMRVHALAEALMQYDTAALLAARLPIPTVDLIDVHQKRGRVLEVLGRYEEAVEAYRALEAMGRTRGDTSIEIGALASLATLFTFPNDAQNLDEARRVNDIVLTLARETYDEPAEARALWTLQQHAYFSGRASEAAAYGKQALALADRLGMRELRAYILNDVSRALVTVESVTSALHGLEEARAIWRETNNLSMLADNLSTTAEIAQMGGYTRLAEQFVHEAQDLSHRIGNEWNLAYSSGLLMQIYMEVGETKLALEQSARTIRLASSSGFAVSANIAKTQSAVMLGELGEPRRGLEILNTLKPKDSLLFLEAWRTGSIAYMHILLGDMAAARATLQETLAIVNLDDLSSPGPYFARLCSAELALFEGRFSDALEHARTLADRMRALEIRFLLPDVLFRQAHAQLGLEDPAAAEASLREAETLARQMSARPILWRILAELSQMERTRGREEQAEGLRQEAREIVDWIAARAPEDLRASFLDRAQVRAVFD